MNLFPNIFSRTELDSARKKDGNKKAHLARLPILSMCMRAPSLWRAMLPSTSVLQLLFVSVFRRSFFATPSSHLPLLCKCCFCLLFRRPCHRHAKLTSASVAQVLLPSFVRRPCPRRDMIPSTYVVQVLLLYFVVAPIFGMPSSHLSRLRRCCFYFIVVAVANMKSDGVTTSL